MLFLPHFYPFFDILKLDKLNMINLLLKKFKKTNHYQNLDGRYWLQIIILNKNYLISKFNKKI